MNVAVQDAELNAAAFFDKLPFSYFFSSDLGIANIVASVYGSVAAVMGPRSSRSPSPAETTKTDALQSGVSLPQMLCSHLQDKPAFPL